MKLFKILNAITSGRENEAIELLNEIGENYENINKNVVWQPNSIISLPLYLAVKHERINVIKKLLSMGANKDAFCKRNGATPYTLARAKKNQEIIDLLEKIC